MALGNSLMVQWLGLRAFTAEGTGSMPWSEHAACPPATPVPFKKRKEGKKQLSIGTHLLYKVNMAVKGDQS